MASKKTKISLFVLFLLCAGAAVYVLYPFHGIPTIYSSTVESTPFQNVVLEKDSAISGTTSSQDSTIGMTADGTKGIQTTKTQNTPSKSNTNIASDNSGTNTSNDGEIQSIPNLPKGKELFAANFKQNYTASSRVRLTEFFNTFKNEDYISGMEFSGIYKRDPTLNKIAKSTICAFIEKNIRFITRKDNSLIIHTVDASGIHTKIKIPFVEDLSINIADQARIDIGQTFTSTEPAFMKSILMPIQLNEIDIIHNGDQFPKKGYISGNFYFFEYSKTKMAYKLR